MSVLDDLIESKRKVDSIVGIPQMLVVSPAVENWLKANLSPAPSGGMRLGLGALMYEVDPFEPEPGWHVETDLCPSCHHTRRYRCPNPWHVGFDLANYLPEFK